MDPCLRFSYQRRSPAFFCAGFTASLGGRQALTMERAGPTRKLFRTGACLQLFSALALSSLGSRNGRSTVIGLWSEIGSGRQLFRSSRVRGKCGSNVYDPFASRGSPVLDFTKIQSSLNLATRAFPQISSVIKVGVNPLLCL